MDSHPKLGDCKNADECYTVARQLVDDYVENREITQQLEHYKKHKTLLKDHDII